MENVAGRIPIREFIDHGANVQPQPGDRRVPAEGLSRAVRQVSHTVAKPGDKIAINGVDVRIVASAGQAYRDAAARRRQREPVLRRLQAEGSRSDARTRSRSAALTFGRFRAVHMGDLTWNKEHRPDVPDRIGRARSISSSCRITVRPISNSPKCWFTRCSRAWRS